MLVDVVQLTYTDASTTKRWKKNSRIHNVFQILYISYLKLRGIRLAAQAGHPTKLCYTTCSNSARLL